MSNSTSKLQVTFVVGPTASGKSAWALQELSRLQNQGLRVALVNCDSIQVFSGLLIGSAFPTPEEMQLVPHHLFGYIPKGGEITAGNYARDFHALLSRLAKDHDHAWVVGGTGFYFQAIEKGLFETGAADTLVKAQVEAELQNPDGPATLHAELTRLDPIAAARISVHDHYRLVRAIEMMRVHGKSVTLIQSEFAAQQKPFPWPLKKIGVTGTREQMLERVTIRTARMLQGGLIEEVEDLLREGLRDWSALQSIGYREVRGYLLKEPLQGELIKTQKELQDRIIQNTMKLVKKQKTWFQRDTEIQWRKLESH